VSTTATPHGRVVVVTGASGGVGRATARAFAAGGDRVALLARGSEGLAAAADEVRHPGGEALVIGVDVSDAKAVDDAAQQVVDTFGPIDVWVNNAFTGVFAPFTEISPDEFRRVTEVTYLGYVFGTQAALRHMLPRDHGTIVQVGSSRRTAGPSTRSRGSTSPCAASCCTRAVGCVRRWCSCRASTPRSSTGC
jgi:NAD(P)-dependent dehydrogenase (short-subunit alcohol dehydrogenase family)